MNRKPGSALKSVFTRTVAAHPGKVLVSFGLLFVLAFALTGRLRFEPDIFELLPRKERAFRVLTHALRTSAASDRLFLLISGGRNPDDLLRIGRRVVTALLAMRSGDEAAFRRVSLRKSDAFGTAEIEELLERYLHAPELFLTPDDVPALERFLTSPAAMEKALRQSLALLATPGASGVARLAALDPLNLRRFMLDKLQRLHQGLSFAPGPYLLAPDRQTLLVVAAPARPPHERQAAAALLQQLDALRADMAPVQIGITGGYALAAQEEALVRSDLLSCLLGSVAAIVLLFGFIYRNFRVVIFIFVPLGIGLQLAVGTMAVFCERVHMLAMAFGAVILGLGIDFAIHVYDRYAHEKRRGAPDAAATEAAVFKTGTAVLAGGLTTLAAFLVLTTTDSPILLQIGWLVTLGLLFCLLTILWALPAFLVWYGRRSDRWLRHSPRMLGLDALGALLEKRPRAVLVLAAVVFLGAAAGLGRLHFEQDPLALRPAQLEAVEVQERLTQSFGTGRQYLLAAWRAERWQDLWAQGRSLDRRLQHLKSTGSVAAWSSVSTIGAAAPPRLAGFDPDAAEALFLRYGLALEDFAASADFLRTVAGRSAAGRRGVPPSPTRSPCDRARRLPALLQRFILCENEQLQGVAWIQTPDMASARRVQEQLRGTLNDTVVVNPRLAVEATVANARGELWRTVGIAAGLVIIILLAFLRKIGAVALVALPMALGLLATAGIMGWAGVHLNIFNFIVLPVLIGIGLDDGIHVFRRFAEIGRVQPTLATTGRSILVTTLTTVCGFGSLSLADYHVLQSMGLLAIAGVGACFFFSVTVLPALLQLRLNRRLETDSFTVRDQNSGS